MNCPADSHDDPRAPYNERHDEGPAMMKCSHCNGSGTNAHELPSRQRFVHGGEVHECYQCEGTGEVNAH